MFETIKEKKLLFLLGIFIVALTTANLLGTKITMILGVSVSVGIFTYPFTFVVTDVVEEVWGKAVSRQFLYVGIIALILLFALVSFFVWLPPAERFANQADAYNSTFKNSLRMIAASLIAFTISQSHDIWSFSFWKQRTQGRFLWLRNNLSTMVSQGLDTFIFMFIAFYHMTDKFTALYVTELALTYWAFKIVFSIIDTPLVYAGVRWVRGKNEE